MNAMIWLIITIFASFSTLLVTCQSNGIGIGTDTFDGGNGRK